MSGPWGLWGPWVPWHLRGLWSPWGLRDQWVSMESLGSAGSAGSVGSLESMGSIVSVGSLWGPYGVCGISGVHGSRRLGSRSTAPHCDKDIQGGGGALGTQRCPLGAFAVLLLLLLARGGHVSGPSALRHCPWGGTAPTTSTWAQRRPAWVRDTSGSSRVPAQCSGVSLQRSGASVSTP